MQKRRITATIALIMLLLCACSNQEDTPMKPGETGGASPSGTEQLLTTERQKELEETRESTGTVVENTYTDGLVFTALSDGTYAVTGYRGSSVDILIPDTYNGYPVTKISEGCFEESDIQTVIVGENVEVIEEAAFRLCSMLKYVELPAALTDLGGRNGGYNTSSQGGVFYRCINLTTVIFDGNSSIEYIDRGTFSGCESLNGIVLPGSITGIGDSAFGGCSSLSELMLPSAITTIGESAFSGCTGLNSLIIPETVTWVGGAAFNGFTVEQTLYICGSSEGWAQYASGTPLQIPRPWNQNCEAEIVYD